MDSCGNYLHVQICFWFFSFRRRVCRTRYQIAGVNNITLYFKNLVVSFSFFLLRIKLLLKRESFLRNWFTEFSLSLEFRLLEQKLFSIWILLRCYFFQACCSVLDEEPLDGFLNRFPSKKDLLEDVVEYPPHFLAILETENRAFCMPMNKNALTSFSPKPPLHFQICMVPHTDGKRLILAKQFLMWIKMLFHCSSLNCVHRLDIIYDTAKNRWHTWFWLLVYGNHDIMNFVVLWWQWW